MDPNSIQHQDQGKTDIQSFVFILYLLNKVIVASVILLESQVKIHRCLKPRV
jgi:hypothetical protein